MKIKIRGYELKLVSDKITIGKKKQNAKSF